MASVLAIVSKPQFEEHARRAGGARVGAVLGLSRYDSSHRALEPLADGGDLFLVTVRPDDVLWLVGVLIAPTRAADHWTAGASTLPVTDVTAFASRLRFANGKGLPGGAGKLAMSLQTPRTLTADDEALLRAAIGASAAVSPPSAPVAAPPAGASAARAPKAKSSAAARPAGAAPAAQVEAAAGALGRGDARGALLSLLDAWRSTRHAALAEAIERLSPLAARGRPPLGGKRRGERVAAWDARAAGADPADFAILADSLFLENSGKAVAAHLEALGRWPADPRLSGLLHELARKVPFTATSARPFWRALFAVLPTVGDPRTRVALDAADAAFRVAFEGRDDYLAYLPNQTRKVRAALADVLEEPLPEATLAALADLGARVERELRPTRSDDRLGALLAAVHASPDDDAPRAVLADAWLDAGDPRGELVTLQLAAVTRELSREERRRERDLIDEHGDAWLGPLAGWTRKGDRVFRRGFLAACTIEQKSRSAGPFPEIAAWSTVEEAVAVAPLPATALASFRALRRLANLSLADLFACAGGPARLPSLVELKAVGRWVPDGFARLGRLSAFPSLLRLRLAFDAMGEDGAWPTAAACLDAFERLSSLTWLRTELLLQRDRWVSHTFDLCLARDGADVVAELRLGFDHDAPEHLHAGLRDVAAALRRRVARTRVLVPVWAERGRSVSERKGWSNADLRALGLPSPAVEVVARTGEAHADEALRGI